MKPRSAGAASILSVALAAGLLALVNLGFALFREAAPAPPSAPSATALLDEVRAIAADPGRRAEFEALGPRLAAVEEALVEIARDPGNPHRAEAVFALRFAKSARAEAALRDVAESNDPAISALAADSLGAPASTFQD